MDVLNSLKQNELCYILGRPPPRLFVHPLSPRKTLQNVTPLCLATRASSEANLTWPLNNHKLGIAD